MGIVELRPGVEINSLQLKYEYEYADQCQIDKELESVMQLFKGTSFKNASVYINNLDKKSAVSSEAKKEFEKSVKTESAANLETLSKVENEKELAGIMTRVINAIKAKDYDSVSDCFSEDGLEMYKKLLNYGQARLLGDPQFSFYTMGKRVVCRSIPMAFSFKNNRRKFVEDVTFTFDENKKIECVAFGLGSQAKTDIFNKGVGAWSDYAKMVIATFLENYKTAFALKRLDYLESVFDDNATIITGHIIKKAPKVAMEGESFINSNNKLIKYTRQTKSEYMRKLKMCFQSNQFINIRFADNDVVKMGAGGETYDATSVLRSLERNIILRGDGVIFSAAEVVSSLDENGCALITAVKSVKADKAVKEAKAAELTAIPDGFAVIKNGRAVGSVPVDCAKGVNVLQNKVGPSSVKLRVGNDTATVQLDKCACRITPMFGGGVLAGLDVKITLSAALSETTGSVGVQELNRALADEVERWVTQVLDISRSLECDFLQLGKVLERKQPQRLHGASADLSERQRDIYYNVGVEAEVDRSFDVGLGSSE